MQYFFWTGTLVSTTANSRSRLPMFIFERFIRTRSADSNSCPESRIGTKSVGFARWNESVDRSRRSYRQNWWTWKNLSCDSWRRHLAIHSIGSACKSMSYACNSISCACNSISYACKSICFTKAFHPNNISNSVPARVNLAPSAN